MDRLIELSHVEISEYCLLNLGNGSTTFYRGKKKIPSFTGFYYCENRETFLGSTSELPNDGTKIIALYPTPDGPRFYYEGKEYIIHPNLNIQLRKKGKKRKFKNKDYGIKIDYLESKWINWDSWSTEIDVDLFYMIEQLYKNQEFYDQYTLNRG